MIDNYSSLYTPGIFVINPDKKNEWGIGQIQSSINNLITVNFENVGKKTINLSKINLEIISKLCSDIIKRFWDRIIEHNFIVYNRFKMKCH